ncbi:unnamed protein product, partial [marine sediment metagenome]
MKDVLTNLNEWASGMSDNNQVTRSYNLDVQADQMRLHNDSEEALFFALNNRLDYAVATSSHSNMVGGTREAEIV